MPPRARRWRRVEEPEDNSDPKSAPAASDTWLSRALRDDVDPALARIMLRGAVHLERVFADTRLVRALYLEVCSAEREPWSRHHVMRPPGGAARHVLSELQELFNVTGVTETRVNVYEGHDSKPRHQDRNAHCSDAGNFTCGASFFSERALAFAPVSAGPEDPDAFVFLQRSGDVFAFNDEVNKAFFHSVPPGGRGSGFRVSVVLWGTRDPALPWPSATR